MNNEKIIVSFTSWEKRINHVAHVIDLMRIQTKPADVIVLNLSEEEFPDKERSLPIKLLEYTKDEHLHFYINWVGQNTKVWKKFMPILNTYPNDVIIPIDDDIEYPKDYIEKMYGEYIRFGRKLPIVCYPNYRKYGEHIGGIYSHSGAFSLIKKDFFGEYLDDIYENVVKKNTNIHWASDEVYSFCVWLNGLRYKYTSTIDGKSIYEKSPVNRENSYSKNYVAFGAKLNKNKELVLSYIEEKYGKNIEDIFSNDVCVNFTTWKKRDKFVETMLKSLSKQTKKPDHIICWLSSDEYIDKKIPEHLERCLNDGLMDEIRWVSKNIYSHKRWEVMKIHPEWFNIFVDDDIIYNEKYVEELYNTALSNQDCAIMWTTRLNEFCGKKRNDIKHTPGKKSAKLQTLSGMSCYPPFVFPNESFEYCDLRDKYCTKCDDSWVRAWLIKCGIEIVGVNDIYSKRWIPIEGTIDSGIWNENKLVNNGIMKIVSNFANAIVSISCVDKAKEMWPNFDIYSCCDKSLHERYCNSIKFYGMTLVYNESHMIPYLMPYYERMGFDKLIVYDNESTDNTVELLKKYPFVEVRTFSTGNEKNNSIQSKLKSEAFKEFADEPNAWMYISDFDEVLFFDGNFRNKLNSIDAAGYTYLNQQMVELVSDKFPDISDNKLVHEKINKCAFWIQKYGCKTTLFKVSGVSAMTYSPGAHSLAITTANQNKSYNNMDIKSFHIKYIDKEFVFNRNKMASVRRSDTDKKRGYGIQYDKLSVESTFNSDWDNRVKRAFPLSDYLTGKKKGIVSTSMIKYTVKPFKKNETVAAVAAPSRSCENSDFLFLHFSSQYGTNGKYEIPGFKKLNVDCSGTTFHTGFARIADLINNTKYKWIFVQPYTTRLINPKNVYDHINRVISKKSNVGIYSLSCVYADASNKSKRVRIKGLRSVNSADGGAFLINAEALRGKVKNVDFSRCKSGNGYVDYLALIAKRNNLSVVIDDGASYMIEGGTYKSFIAGDRRSFISINKVDEKELNSNTIKTDLII